ncbi:hypothetical protein DCAR_0103344 [Daucus carota subsp. sativus]|uniref:Uncharacterized protein n=1 Tax=Daucus carota subsp. sativus TaxID=79200 RepID=A0A162AL52_DAUCS|nr:PREDICTED: uncharacterized protein LOC108201970 isoform X2 [Daucus carota subsp. sativus]WOG84163.1 hypothetical protein DCAR_0103344 [Daucus carota subsp. sativus]
MSSLYPSIDSQEVAEKLFPETDSDVPIHRDSGENPPAFESSEEILIKIPGAIVHLIDKKRSVQLASGELNIVRLRQGDNVVAVLARVGDEVQWPLAKDEPAVKLNGSHYFFSLRVPEEEKGDGEELLNYGLSIAAKGQEDLLREFDGILESCSAFSVKEVKGEVVWGELGNEVSPGEMAVDGVKKEEMERNSGAFWTALAPNVEDYSGSVARMIAAGSGQVIKGILWCGDLTVGGMKWGDEYCRKRMGPRSDSDISPQTLRRMKRVKKLTKMSEDVATALLSGAVKVSGFFTSPIVNSKLGKKFFNLLPGEIVLASLDGFNKVFDAVEVAGRNVMSTTSVVTTGLVTDRYGDEAAKVTSEGLDAAGHAIGTAWAVFKIRKALNPKSFMNPTNLAKAAARANSSDLQAKYKKST